MLALILVFVLIGVVFALLVLEYFLRGRREQCENAHVEFFSGSPLKSASISGDDNGITGGDK